MAKAISIEHAPRRVRTPDGEARGAILTTTERLLGERRLHELSATEIAEEAGVSRGILYFYFAGKSAVLAALAEQVCEDLHDIWQSWFDGHGPLDAAEIRQNFQASLRLWTEHRAILVATVESWRLDPEVGAVWGTMMARLVDDARARIERDRAAGHAVGSGDAAALATTLVWGAERVHYVALAGIASALEDPERIVDATTALWVSLLSPVPPAPDGR